MLTGRIKSPPFPFNGSKEVLNFFFLKAPERVFNTSSLLFWMKKNPVGEPALQMATAKCLTALVLHLIASDEEKQRNS